MVGVCDNPEAMYAGLEAVGFKDARQTDMAQGYASTWNFDSPKGQCIVMRFPPDMVDNAASVIAHECLHVTQMIHEDVGEYEPGREAHAYLLDYLVEFTMDALSLKVTRVRKKKNEVPETTS